MSKEITKEPLANTQGTIDAAIKDDVQFADWLRRASLLGELVVRRGDEEYVLDLSKLRQP